MKETWDEIRKVLKQSEVSNRDLAASWGVSEGSVSRFLSGQLHSKRLAGLLAELLRVPVKQIPDAYRCPTCHRKYDKAS